ncbi:hypothetical protein [Bacillus sp. ISL-39]|uniref:RNA polymerase sigma factor n=1 Tax=Bacillus sp. ISL-39 TaxID=2819124 RepID=UPI001BE7B3AE|nr:hypothetical protein [Bacillus sp. ISL-39]MBT2638141.1 hypothetical protein [Bacillus sp. ISL-39]
MNDDELVFRARNGNMQAFAELINIPTPTVKRFAFLLGNKYDDIDDITQEVFVRVYRFFNILKQYGPFEIMQLNFHADQAGDFETKYALYSKDGGQPPEEQYIQEMKEATMAASKVLKGYEFASLYNPDDDPEKVIGIQLHFNDRPDASIFQMVQEDCFWKVQYLPFQ